MKITWLLFACFMFTVSQAQVDKWKGKSVDLSHGKLKVSENKRFLVFEDGTPFFYLGDTAWELFHRLNKEESEKYLENRRERGFSVIQAVFLAEIDGLNTPNAEGEKPLIDNDPEKINPAYADYVEWVVKRAEEKGMFIGLLPTWGDKWNRKWGVGPVVFTPENAAAYGEALGKKFKDTPNIIWILGGDRSVDDENHRQIIKSMAEGLRKGDGGNHLITFHPQGGQGSAQYFHDEAWLDFNMRQNGHTRIYTHNYENTLHDYNRTPVKPVMDGEPIYEDHPIEFKPEENGHSTSADVRRPLYWNLFNGAFGHTYGHHSVWQMWQPGKQPINFPLMPWYEAINQPGAEQMQYGRRLIESRPFLIRIPDNSVIAEDEVPTAVPGAGAYKYVATRASDGSYAMVYIPVGRKFKVNMDVISGDKVTAWWYSPRNGQVLKIGKFLNVGTREFTPPAPGENMDWVLVLDDASKRFGPPGKL